MKLPRYDELPPAPIGGRSAWGLFGPDDDIGLMNLQTPERIAAAGALIERGAVFPLNAEVGLVDPPMFGRRPPVHRLLTTPGDPGLDDELDQFNPQASSQWDSLAHVPYDADAFYNGRTLADIRNGRNTIDHWARRGITGRGIVLDVQPLLVDADADDPGASTVISIEMLERCRIAAGIEYQPGDVLLLHTGYLAWYRQQSDEARAGMAVERALTAVGVEHTEAMAEYLWNSHVSAIASDNPAVEVWPPASDRKPFGFLHQMLIGQFGMALGELWWLSDLAADCRADGRYTAFFSSAPMHVAGGVSSTPNAVAIK